VNKDTKILKKVSNKYNPTVYKKDNASQPSEVYPIMEAWCSIQKSMQFTILIN